MKILFLLATLAISSITLSQQGLYISTEGFLHNENNVITVVDGDFVNASSTVLNGGSLQMKGLDGNPHKLRLSNANTFNYLELSGTSSFDLEGALILNNELLFADGSVNFNMIANSQVILDPAAEITGEFGDNTITGADGTYIKTTRNHKAGVSNDFGNIGVYVTNGTTSMGNTEVYRRYATFDIDGNATVNRYYEINPTVNEGLDINAQFYLSEVDLNGLERTSLAAFRSTDNGSSFSNEGGTPSTYFHLVELIDSFSIWTFADASVLSIEDIGDLNQNFSIVPNPASFKVNILSNIMITLLELVTLSGKTINAKLNADSTFDVSNLSEGVYFLKIHFGDRHVTKRLIIKK